MGILRTNAELECVEAAEARAGQQLIDLAGSIEQAAERPPTVKAPAPAARRQARRN